MNKQICGVEFLLSYTFMVKHKAWKENKVLDSLSNRVL
jgi:hypothetical protein